MNNSTPNTPILDDDAVAEIAARRPYTINSRPGLNIILTAAERDALCATVRALRGQYESAVSDFAAEINSLQSQLEQVTKERDRLKEDLRILTQGRFIQS